VDVRLLLPGPNIDNMTVRFSAHNHYDDLVEAGVKVYEYQPTFAHAKYLVVDGEWSIIGSANLNSRSRKLDEENVFGILDAALGAELESLFTADSGKSEQIALETWRRRNPFWRVLEGLSRILDHQS
jgi:cardiolipin synthase